MLKGLKIFGFVFIILCTKIGHAQVNGVVFGKNRIQYKKFNWKLYQTDRYNVYCTNGGVELAKYILQAASEEVPQLENFMEYSLQGRIEFIIYNHFDDYKQSNLGLNTDWQSSTGITKLVDNKIVLYFDGNHQNLRKNLRLGIAKKIVDNLLFGEDIGEVAANSALLDLPEWLTNGYIKYCAENWNTALDDELRDNMLNAEFKNFYQFAFKKPDLAGQAFWYYFEEKYKRENVTYFLYLTRIYKSLNKASQRICKKKLKQVLADFMEYEQEKYYNDLKQRKNAPKGNISVMEDVSETDLFKFQINPNPRNNNYAVVRYKKGKYIVAYIENFYDEKILLKTGVRFKQSELNPNYPILAWDPKGTKLLTIYWSKGKIKFFVYDIISNYNIYERVLDKFDQVLDASFMMDANTLVLSAVKNGHSDIYIYKIEQDKLEQVTNDVYDDLNPTFVSFPNRSGIIFSSNRPSGNSEDADTVLPSRYRYNIFLTDIMNKTAVKQITKLSDVKFGDAKFPMQYNTNHFTYVSNENGIENRWAGFFSTQREGLDTLYFVGTEILHNPTAKDLDSTLLAWKKMEPDNIGYFQVYKDSTYTFPITNYSSNLLETRIAGNNGLVSEVRRDGDFKMLYKLRVNEDAIRQRNVNAKPTEYRKRILAEERKAYGSSALQTKQASNKKTIIFRNEFENELPDSNNASKEKQITSSANILSSAKLFNYRSKFSADQVISSFDNTSFTLNLDRYNGGFGPIFINSSSNLNTLVAFKTKEHFGDHVITGGYRFQFDILSGNGIDLSNNEYFVAYKNYKRRLDWGLAYYRKTTSGSALISGTTFFVPTRNTTNVYQASVSYPFSVTDRLSVSMTYRTDKFYVQPFYTDGSFPYYPDTILLKVPQPKPESYLLTRTEFVHDNTLNPAINIWDGLRYKVYMDVNAPADAEAFKKSRYMLNFGFDVRNYVPIYRHFTWALRFAGDFSWGNQKICYFLGGVDGWLLPRFNNNVKPANDVTYAYQGLGVNLRGFKQNIANGNNYFIINSEFRLPILTTLLNQPINSAFLRNLQLVQFIDLGSAWNGKYNAIKRPEENYDKGPISIKVDAGGIGPFAGGYGFGIRTTVWGTFIKYDVAWPMKGIFMGLPVEYLALGFDF